MGIKFVPFNRRENRRSLAIFFAEEIAHLGALKIARFCGGSGKNRRRNRRESRDFGALRAALPAQCRSIRKWPSGSAACNANRLVRSDSGRHGSAARSQGNYGEVVGHFLGGGTLTRGNDIRVTPGMTVR